MTAEYWVMRIVRANVMRAHPLEIAQYNGAIDRGELQIVNGDLVEPIEVYDDDQEAANARAVAEHARTGCMHKVVLNAEL